ncbi:NYN domain-containing protein [Mycena epipterygia]|nr:NYN domain-containing protein [Mycena epipterygia]
MQSNNLVSSDVVIFWDYENCHASSTTSGYEIVSGIRNVAHRFGSVKSFKAYMEMPEPDTPRSLSLRSELQSSGVSLTDCPHNGRKNVADQMMMVDMLAYAMDHPAPATLILISGDRDFAYAVSVLRLRRYDIVVISLPVPGAHISLKSQASVCLDWNVDVMGYPNSSLYVEGSSESTTAARGPPTSPIARRASYLFGSESPYSGPRAEQPAMMKPVPSAVPFNEPTTSRTVPTRESPIEHSHQPLTAEQQPEAVCVPAPAYSPKFTPIPKASSLGPGGARTATPINVIPTPKLTPSQSQGSAGPSWEVPVPSSSALFSEDLVSAHIQRCMDMVADQPLLSSQIPAPSANTNIPAPSANTNMPAPTPTIPIPHEPVGIDAALHNDPISTEGQPSPKSIPPLFESLIESLRKLRAKGMLRPVRSVVAQDIITKDKMLYKKAGVQRFSQFSALAEKAKIIELGGREGNAWISLHPDWCN